MSRTAAIDLVSGAGIFIGIGMIVAGLIFIARRVATEGNVTITLPSKLGHVEKASTAVVILVIGTFFSLDPAGRSSSSRHAAIPQFPSIRGISLSPAWRRATAQGRTSRRHLPATSILQSWCRDTSMRSMPTTTRRPGHLVVATSGRPRSTPS